jgi:hypothetical protein
VPRRRAGQLELRPCRPADGTRLLGNLAVRAGEGRRIQWDGPAMRCKNLPALDGYLKTTYRDDWRIL